MATRKAPKRRVSKKPANGNGNGGRATVRDVLHAVEGVHTRIDATNTRIDDLTVQGAAAHESAVQQRAEWVQGNVAMETRLTTAIDSLRKAVNDRLHAIEADVTTLKRPWVFIKSGWTKFGVGLSVASTLIYTLARLGIHFPF